MIGNGHIDGRGNRCRVVDVWYSDEDYGGGIGGGFHVFYERATGADDLPGEMKPNWYQTPSVTVSLVLLSPRSSGTPLPSTH